jgi:hypothetical protein
MKFLCVDCDTRMEFAERAVPGDGTFAAAFRCPACGRTIALLANPMETRLVESLGVQIGGRTPRRGSRWNWFAAPWWGRDDAFVEAEPAGEPARGSVQWSGEARSTGAGAELVRGMVKRIYADYAREQGIATITPEMMDRARSDLGLEGM